MNGLILAAGLAVSSGQVVIETPTYRVTSSECDVAAMAWTEHDDRHFGKVVGSSCQSHTVTWGQFQSPSSGEHWVTASVFNATELMWFECVVTGLSTSPYQITLFCEDDPIFTDR